MRAPDILRKAGAEMEARAAQRDCPGGERSMARTVAAFNGLMGPGKQLTEAEGWIFMCCLKLARGTAGGTSPDDPVDLAAYAALWGESAAPKIEMLFQVEKTYDQAGGVKLVDPSRVRWPEGLKPGCV